MKIAIIAWGSLVERPGTLRLATTWQLGGPKVPVEFSRCSSGERLTLVIDFQNGRSVPTRFAISELETLEAAIENLRDRERTPNRENIGYAIREGKTHRANNGIIQWLADTEFDAAIWTALPSNFSEKVGDPFSVERAVTHLRGLPPESQRTAFEYFEIAPSDVMTPLRERLIAEGLVSPSMSGDECKSSTAVERDADFIEWCKETENDPSDPGSRELFDEHVAEIEAETGDKFWSGLSPEDREGYESMMTDDR